MRQTKAVLLAAALTLFGATRALAVPACPPEPASVEPVRQTILTVYDALTRDDARALGQLLAPDFHAYENGKAMEGAVLTGLIRDAHARGVVYQWSPEDIDIHVRCDMAWASWVNRGAVGGSGDMKPVSWLESAALSYRDGRWVMDFLHATRVPEPPKG